MSNRFEKETFVQQRSDNSQEVLTWILEERRKELYLRGLRWEDLRRLNQDFRFEQTLSRKVNGQIYKLKPNSNRYVWPIPDNEVDLNGLNKI